MAAAQDDVIRRRRVAAMYNHWIGTIPWLWTLAGLAGLALFVGLRRGGVPRWIGLVGLVLGGLTVLLGISPLEYMAGVTGVLWLLVTAVGFTLGDKAYRAAADEHLQADTGRPGPHGPGRPARPQNVPVTQPGPAAGGRCWCCPALAVACSPPRSRSTSLAPSTGPGVELAEGYGWPYAVIGLVFAVCGAVVLAPRPAPGVRLGAGLARRSSGRSTRSPSPTCASASGPTRRCPGSTLALWVLTGSGRSCR